MHQHDRQSAPSHVEPGVNIHLDGGAKVRLDVAQGANEVAPKTIALTAAFIDRLAQASHARRALPEEQR